MKLSIQELSVSYRIEEHELLALDKVSLDLLPGRIMALVGESGSGKTTLGKALMGLLPQEARATGSIQLAGEELLGARQERLNQIRWSELAMLFQNGAQNLNPAYQILDQVAEPLVQRRGLPRDKARELAAEGLERQGLDPDLGRKYPHELSGGEVQRCLLAMALILDPELLILDEPTAALDARIRSMIAGSMLQARFRGRGMLLITHDLDLAASLADQVFILYMGQVLEVLPGRELFFSPAHPYTMALSRSYPSLDTRRELGGIRGDAFYRVLHRHKEKNGQVRPHSHIVGAEAEHEDGHLPPQGCLYQNRCTQAVEECSWQEVALLEINGRKVRCLRQGIVNTLELQGISKAFGSVQAVEQVDLKLQAGQTFCLVGESGSGKSTLAMTAAGILAQDQGQRMFQGRDMQDWIQKDYLSLARRIGLVQQDPAQSVSHRFTVLDIVAEPLRIQKISRDKAWIRQKALQALQDVNLATDADFIRRYPHELNMGALQRVCMARALVTDPDLLVADEPTSSLDPSVQAKVLKMILGLQIEKGLTLFFVTHDLGLAGKIADRAGVMLSGRLVELGPAARVLQDPAHPYTRSLLQGARGVLDLGYGQQETSGMQSGGCPFASRCSQALDECWQDFPGQQQAGPGGHLVWCYSPLQDTTSTAASHRHTCGVENN
ncbi:MAG: ABC transporter ATP-binding protein [Desulfohalobiaceae bacterium]